MERLAILVGPKGRGSNMRAIAEACASGLLEAEVAVVISPKVDNPASETATSLGIPVAVVPPGESYEADLTAAVGDTGIVCLAGFMRLLPLGIVQSREGRVLNIHPSLLPKFGGQGMFGRKVHEAVLAAGETQSGCTVHIVSERYDEGPVVLQKRCPVLPDDTAETLEARVLALEHQAYPEAIGMIIDGWKP